ncbi:hypothetical protein PHMEG_00038616 [Phytophthora megakarya]|uniref:CCHC-type domain-containing protein n=1 Tax=Phytophthora megakarya TaxID=4795 RepID=A0A225UHF0_9STRA|nr:hypothetical protein PHMEG_00038616 [Phytophthora megakarya]
MWKVFVDKQTKKEYSNYIFARQRLLNNPYTPDRSIDDWLREMQLVRQELSHYKKAVSDEDFAEIILCNVGKTHRDVVRQFSRHYDPGLKGSAPSSRQVMNALREESELDARIEEPQTISSAQSGKKQGKHPNQQSKGKKQRGRGRYKEKGNQGGDKNAKIKVEEESRECWNCHEVGHSKPNCPHAKRDDDESDSQLPERKRWQNKSISGGNCGNKKQVDVLSRRQTIDEDTVATQNSMSNNVEWILDSASDCHVCTNKDLLSSLRQDNGPLIFDWEGKPSQDKGLVGELSVRVKNENRPN